MNKFELYTLIYYALEIEWEENHSKNLGNFLSSANPFLFEDIGSAIPYVYTEFCKSIEGDITVENSFGITCKYIKSLEDYDIEEAFSKMTEEKWKAGAKEFLEMPHKGDNLN